MTTYGALLGDIRVDLKDTGTTQKFSDQNLFIWFKDAIKDYSGWFPMKVDRLTVVLDSNYGVDLPTDFLQDYNVECPPNTFLEKRLPAGGIKFTTPSSPTLYYISGGRLYLDAAPPDTVYLTYGALHTIPTSYLSTTTVLSIPPRDEELIRLYVLAKANEQTSTKQTSIDRFKLGSGRRDDNPLNVEVDTLMDEYLAKVSERTAGGAIKLFRPGRIR
ncbi:MAG: phage adaptor protein [bacterium]